MKTQDYNTQEKNSKSSSYGKLKSPVSGESTFQFVDNSPEAVAQRKLREMANNSTHALQLKVFQVMANNSPQANKTAQLQATAYNSSTQQQQPVQKKENNTGLPDNLKTGIENLSGMSLNNVKVHRNSYKPAQLNAHAYAQGTDIHLGPGQEKHLSHEAWHVVQQKQGRVQPTTMLKAKVPINDDQGLEKEADVMGAKAENMTNTTQPTLLKEKGINDIQSAQLKTVTIKTTLINDHQVYDNNLKPQGTIAGGSVIEVDPNDGHMIGKKNYVKITNYNGLIKFKGGGDVGYTPLDTDLRVRDSAFEGEAEDQERNVTTLSAGPITYHDGIVTIPVLGQDLKIGEKGGSFSGALPSEEFKADLPNVSFNIDVPFGPGVYATAGLAVTPSLTFEVSGGKIAITVEGEEKSISIKDAKVEGSIGLEINASAGVGVGAANIVGLDAGVFAALGGKASLGGKLEGNADFAGKKYEVSLGMKAETDIEGRAGAFVKARFGLLSARKNFPLANKTFAHFSYERTLSLGSSQDNLKPTLEDFTKKEFGDFKTNKKLKTVNGKTYQELHDEDDE